MGDEHDNEEPGPRRLQGQPSHGTHSGFSPFGALLFGTPFVGVGVLVMLIGLQIIPVDDDTVHAPYWVIASVGLVFAAAGLLVWGMGVRQWWASQRTSGQGAVPGKAGEALRDYPWERDGTRSRLWRRAFVGLGWTLFMTIFLAPFNFWMLSDDGGWIVTIVVGLFDLILVAMIWGSFILVARALKFGASRVTFAGFPIPFRQPITLQWHSPAGVRTARSGKFTLRCIQQTTESSGSGDERTTTTVHDALWEETWRFREERRFDRSTPLPLKFEKPGKLAKSTRLSSTQPVYWELQVKLDLPGLDFEECYLIPVY